MSFINQMVLYLESLLDKSIDCNSFFEKDKNNTPFCNNWIITPSKKVNLIYSPRNLCEFAAYGFEVRKNKNFVEFYNIHREASPTRRGVGSKTLQQLESVFEELSNKNNIKVKIIFGDGVEYQESTQKWLLKNGYKKVNKDYFKEFC